MKGMILMNWKLKEKIYEKFQNQSDFAHALKVHESNVSQVIRGRRDLDENTQKKWAEVLGDDPQRLFQKVKRSTGKSEGIDKEIFQTEASGEQV